jgi:hypothetical protein
VKVDNLLKTIYRLARHLHRSAKDRVAVPAGARMFQFAKLFDLTVRKAGHEETRPDKQVDRDQHDDNQTFKKNHTPPSDAEFYTGKP